MNVYWGRHVMFTQALASEYFFTQPGFILTFGVLYCLYTHLPETRLFLKYVQWQWHNEVAQNTLLRLM